MFFLKQFAKLENVLRYWSYTNLAISKAKSKLTDLVNRAKQEEEVVLTSHGTEVVKLVPIRPVVNLETKMEILSRLLEESKSIIWRDTDAAHSQDFLYGEDGMPN